MEKPKQAIVGVDISKACFDFYFRDVNGKKGKGRPSNDKEGFEQFLKMIPSDVWVVMEASGPYYYQLACFLHEKGIKVAVVNPLVIRRFMRGRLAR